MWCDTAVNKLWIFENEIEIKTGEIRNSRGDLMKIIVLFNVTLYSLVGTDPDDGGSRLFCRSLSARLRCAASHNTVMFQVKTHTLGTARSLVPL